MSESVISVSELTRRFGATTALDSVSVSLPRGAVYGLVGANGAGKTTLIRHILGLLRAESGSVRVFGLDPVADPVGVLSRIGYLSEENDLPDWMRVDELIRYSRAFYPAWNDAYAEELWQTFALDAAAKIKTLSKGQKARAGRRLIEHQQFGAVRQRDQQSGPRFLSLGEGPDLRCRVQRERLPQLLGVRVVPRWVERA